MKFGETLVLLGIFVVLPTIIVWLVSRYKKHETDKRAEIALTAIEKDSGLDLEAFFRKMNPQSRTIKEKLLDKLLCVSSITMLPVSGWNLKSRMLSSSIFFITLGNILLMRMARPSPV